MTFIHTIILGIVEGLTEFLPVSSTGHLILASELLQIPDSDFLSSFQIAIQVGAILAVMALYAKKIMTRPKVLIPIGIAFVPTAVIGFLLYTMIKNVFFGNVWIVLTSLVLGGFLMLYLEHRFGKKIPHHRPHKKDVDEEDARHYVDEVSPKNAFLIGVCQAFAVIPGVSRSAATIMGGLGLGLSRDTVVEFSFLLAVPTILAATGYDLLKTGFSFTNGEWLMMLLGSVVSFVVAFLVIRWFLDYVRKGTFIPFAWYRIAIAAVIAGIVLVS